MEHLLPEIAAGVASYLSPQDLSACCAVSLHWREVFGTNQVWKHLCDPELEEHLRTTPCVVEPVFSVSMEQDFNSSLAPLSQWRQAFLREQHLWSNWQRGNFKTVEHEVEAMKTSLERFVTNDFIMSFNLYSVELWDVRPVSPVRVDSLVFGRKMYYDPTVLENAFVVLKSHFADLIQVLKVDVVERTITLKCQFLFNERTQSPELVAGSDPVVNDQYSLDAFDIIVTKGRFCIGYFWFMAGSNSFHIWDLESGIKLKKESCQTTILGGGLSVVGCKPGSRASDDVLILVPDSIDSQPSGRAIVRVECQVYNVQQLKFLSFKQYFSVFPEFLSDSTQSFELCAITNNFVALTDCDDKDIKTIRIFNYLTGHQLYILEVNSNVQVISDACFIFTIQKYLSTEEEEEEVRLCSVFCPSGDIVKDVTGFDVEHFEVVGNRLVEVVPINPINIVPPEVWGIHRFSTFKTTVTFLEFKEVNRACTKLISDGTVEDVEMIRISHFW